MGDIANFQEHCIEAYKRANGMSVWQASTLFREFDVLGFLRRNYRALHSQGLEYVVEDIGMCIEARRG